MNVKPIVKYLGGTKTFKKDVSGIDELRVVAKILPFETISVVANRLNISEKVLLEKISTSSRTAARRLERKGKGKGVQVLKADESDRLFRLVRVANEAEVVFGSTDKANRWLQSPLVALNGETPFQLLDSDLGSTQVHEILSHIDEGIIS